MAESENPQAEAASCLIWNLLEEESLDSGEKEREFSKKRNKNRHELLPNLSSCQLCLLLWNSLPFSPVVRALADPNSRRAYALFPKTGSHYVALAGLELTTMCYF